MMTLEADFCGDKLRLAAFLRVVADGMPQRPTRFKRRFVAIDHELEPKVQCKSDPPDAKSSPATDAARQQCLVDTSNPDAGLSSLPHPPELAAEEHQSTNPSNSGFQEDCRQFTADQLQIDEQMTETVIAKPIKQPRKISSTQRRRHFPVNELALLRTTSSYGPPSPSDIDHLFAVPVAALDPIEDSQMRSAILARNPARQSRGHRVGELSLARRAKPGSPALLLREQPSRDFPAKSKGPHSSASSRQNFAAGSDGFVGIELILQQPTRLNKPRASNRSRAKKTVCVLNLASGYLPAPPIEHQHNDASMTEPRLHIADFQALGAAKVVGGTRPLSVWATTENHNVAKAMETGERRVQQYDDLVRGQSSSVTAPNRDIYESPSSSSTTDADEVVTHSRRSSLDLDNSHEQFTSQWQSSLSTERAQDGNEVERHLDLAMRNLNAAC